MGYNLFIDDERLPPQDDKSWVICKDWPEVKEVFEGLGAPSHISFDHDLGEHTLSGYEIAKIMVSMDMDDPEFNLPDDLTFYVHSQNPVGKQNIEKYISNYMAQR